MQEPLSYSPLTVEHKVSGLEEGNPDVDPVRRDPGELKGNVTARNATLSTQRRQMNTLSGVYFPINAELPS